MLGPVLVPVVAGAGAVAGAAPATPLDATTFIAKLDTLKSEKELLEKSLKTKEAQLETYVNKSKKGLFEQAPSLQDHDTKLITKELLGNFAKDVKINDFINKNGNLLTSYRSACDFFSMQITKCAELGVEFITFHLPSYIYTPETDYKIVEITTTDGDHDKNDFIHSCYRKPDIFLKRKAKIEEFAKSGVFKMTDKYKTIFAALVHACIKDVWIKTEHMQAIRSYIKKERILFDEKDRTKITAAIIYTDIICGIHNTSSDTKFKAKKELAIKIKAKDKEINKDTSDIVISDIIIDIIKPSVPLIASASSASSASIASIAPVASGASDEATEDMINIYISLNKSNGADRKIDKIYKFNTDSAKYFESRRDGDCGFSAIAQIYENKDDKSRDGDTAKKINALRKLLKDAYTVMDTKPAVKAQLNPLYDDKTTLIKNSNEEDMTFPKYADFISNTGNWAMDDDFIIIMKLLGDLPFILISEQGDDVVVSYNNVIVHDALSPYYIFYNVNGMHWQLRKPVITPRVWDTDIKHATEVLKALA